MDTPYRTALIVGAGSGISASFARGLAAAGLESDWPPAMSRSWRPWPPKPGAEKFSVDAADPAAVARLFEEAEDASRGTRCRALQRRARAHGPIAELDPGSGAHGYGDLGLWRLSGGAAGGPANDPARQRRDPADRRQRQRQRLPALGGFCDGQVCACAAWRRARRASWGRKASMSLISSSMAACAARVDPTRQIGRTARSTPTRSRRPISRCCVSRAAPGLWRSSCAPGSRPSDARERRLGALPGPVSGYAANPPNLADAAT